MPLDPRRILYKDDHLLAVNKLPGELVVRGKGELGKLPLLDFLRKEFPGLRAVHRLDFQTSGVVVFARTKEAEANILNSKFAQWEKTYVALVAGDIRRKDGVIRKPLPARSGGTVPAETRYRVLKRFGPATLVEAVIATGRHHQIRRHFAGIGHPLLFDSEYGDRRRRGRRLFLHAERVRFPHPITGEMMNIEAPLPQSFSVILKNLEG